MCSPKYIKVQTPYSKHEEGIRKEHLYVGNKVKMMPLGDVLRRP